MKTKLLFNTVLIAMTCSTVLGQVNNNNNTAYGNFTGNSLTSGTQNAFFGANSGQFTNSGYANTFIGHSAGQNNQSGRFNTFIGTQAGQFNTSGYSNIMVGTNAGRVNTEGRWNFFLGDDAGSANTIGEANVFLGLQSGGNNTTGQKNTAIGFQANVGSGSLINATAIGANAVVTQSNSLVLGNGVNVGIGVTAPLYKLTVAGTIAAREVNVTTEQWSDFVFDTDYQLASLAEVEYYIRKYKHLPEIPSAAEVESQGIELGKMNAKLLQKIEELTLYVIQQQKTIERQQKNIDYLNRRLSPTKTTRSKN